jgi:FMN-dependent NADH-azoreductase
MPRYSADTLAAIAEVEEMITHPENYKGVHSIEELMKELDSADEV